MTEPNFNQEGVTRVTSGDQHQQNLQRTSSGREIYYPNGIAPEYHQPSRTGNSIPSQPGQSSSNYEMHYEGLFSDAHGRREEEEVVEPLEPIERTTSSSSGDSSTQIESSEKGRRVSRRESFNLRRYSTIEGRGQVAEMDEDARRELTRIFTTESRVARTMSIAQPDDPAVDPSSESFDIAKFLRMFRKQIEGEGVELKKVSVVYKNLNVFGSGKALQLQQTVGDLFMAPFRAGEFFGKSNQKQILHRFDGIIKAGELCIVLGRPGSGCSTLLKALTGELHGLNVDDSIIHYNGISQKRMIKEFMGEMVYNQEVDKHFPHLTVGQTLEHAAALRTPANRPMGMSRQDFSKFMTQVIMAVVGLSHTYNTKVGNDFVRGVSGGERKRVSVAEMMLAGAPFASWDNSTRGLDSATALKFVRVSLLNRFLSSC